MTTTQSNLWDMIKSISRKTPFSLREIESILATSLGKYEEPSNDAFDFFQGSGVCLDDGIELTKISLRLSQANPATGILLFEIAGPCIRIDEVRAYYPLINVSETPRGRSLDEATVFSTTQSWSRVSFGFRERKPECLSFVVLKTE